MTDRLTAEAREALDAVRRHVHKSFASHPKIPSFGEAILAALENLDARIRALESRP